MTAHYISVYLHVLAAIFWLGGMFFLATVGAPVLRRVEPPTLRASLFRQLGARFRTAGWIAIAILVATGVTNLKFRGLLSTAVLGDAGFWRTPLGIALAIKLACVVLMIGLSALHDFWLGPAAGRLDPDTPEAARLRRASSWVARVNALIGLVLLYAAVRLAR